MPVKMPVSDLDCEAILHPIFAMSSRKYFKYDPYFTGILWKSCGKECAKAVDKYVENIASFFGAGFSILSHFPHAKAAVGNNEKNN